MLTDDLLKQREGLLNDMPYAADNVNEQAQNLTTKWDVVKDLADKRRKRLEEMAKLHQVNFVFL